MVGGFTAIIWSEPNYSFGRFVFGGCGYCWAVTITLQHYYVRLIVASVCILNAFRLGAISCISASINYLSEIRSCTHFALKVVIVGLT